MKTTKLKISQLRADYGANVRFRDNYGDISELADNIRAKGIQVPLSVEALPDGSFGIISGHRRYAALQMLIEQRVYTDETEVLCTVQAYESEIQRTAGKLLANDGQPLSSDEWAAEIARLADDLQRNNPDVDFVAEIAAALGKRPEYVKQMHDTWKRMSAGAKKAIQSGKVGMGLAVLLAKKAVSDKLASLSVEIAAAAKDSVKQSGENVSDAVVAEAVVLTTDKVIKDTQQGKPITGAGIGADILANILKVKGAKQAAGQAAKQAKKAAISGRVTDMKQYVSELIDLSNGQLQETLKTLLANFNGGIAPADAIHSLVNKFHKAA